MPPVRPVAETPAANQWVEWVPPKPGEKIGSARLSEKAVLWIVDTLSVVRALRGVRDEEHTCLDQHEAKGLIRQ